MLWPWVPVSLGLHALVLLLAFGRMGGGVLAGHGVEDGRGFGGHAVELEIRGERSPEPRGALAPSAATPPPAPAEAAVELDREDAVEATEGEVAVRDVPVETRRGEARDPRDGQGAQASELVRPGRADTEALGDADGREEGATGEMAEASGTGDDDSTAGVSPGEQARDAILGSAGLGGDSATARNLLLPNGGACDDPVTGTWRAQKYRVSDHTWVRFVLRVRRDGDALSGTITSRIWTGTASDPTPGECTAFGFDHTWRMSARGRLDGDRFTFRASRHRLVRQDCPSSQNTMYAPDSFRGTLHPMREVYDALNNDGAFDIDEPYTFRRVGCE